MSRAVAHPSLALVKYWGKVSGGVNLPATGSVAVSLEALATETEVSVAASDRLEINGDDATTDAARRFFDAVRTFCGREEIGFHARSSNSFPTGAGLASSASGYAALALASVAAADRPVHNRPALSALARAGSGSASRSVFGGFVLWRAGAEAAQQIHDEQWWPDLRIVAVPMTTAAKPVGSREAMQRARGTSPYYNTWVNDAPRLVEEAQRALTARDIERLGRAMQQSYLAMFATMFTSRPPVIYWLPSSVEALHRLDALRRDGIAAWETMDAGPQIKVVTLASSADAVVDALGDLAAVPPIVSRVGGPARLV